MFDGGVLPFPITLSPHHQAATSTLHRTRSKHPCQSNRISLPSGETTLCTSPTQSSSQPVHRLSLTCTTWKPPTTPYIHLQEQWVSSKPASNTAPWPMSSTKPAKCTNPMKSTSTLLHRLQHNIRKTGDRRCIRTTHLAILGSRRSMMSSSSRMAASMCTRGGVMAGVGGSVGAWP